MKPKIIKYNNGAFRSEVTVTIDENLNKLKGTVLAPEKLKAANKQLGKLKNVLPK